MGLDQYLYRGDPADEDGTGEEVGYWRKANMIHAWMEDHLNGGESSNLERLPINLEQLAGLRQTCQRVLDEQLVGADALPTRPGFFFGGTEYDEYYLSDLRETVDIIDKVFAWEAEQPQPGAGQYYYWSWW